jgi:mono/diheme cytochrome c family protein
MCRALVLVGTALVLATGYFGGELVYGEGHLFKYFEAAPETKPDVMAEPLPVGGAAPAATVDFVRDVAPIIRTSCLKCHGPEKIKGRLRLDTKEAAMTGGKHGASIVPGHSDKSRLYRLLMAPAPDDRMPQKADALPSHEVAVIRAWIDQGAAWPDGYIVKK